LRLNTVKAWAFAGPAKSGRNDRLPGLEWVRAGEVDLTTTALLSLPHEPLPYPGQHETRQLTRWNGSTLILVFAAVAGWSFLNGADGVIANTWIRFRQAPTAAGQAANNRSGRATVKMPNTSALSH
jgi:hypothetical protein